jgi:DNA polymerase-3 subunit alpha
VLPPDINLSDVGFVIEVHHGSLNNQAIRFGLSAIKNIGGAAIDSILKARADGPFKSLSDFAKRVDLAKVNRKSLESLIKAGAMDKFGTKASMLVTIDLLISESSKKNKMAAKGQEGLFADEDDVLNDEEEMPNFEEFDKDMLLSFEKEYFGFYLSEHPALKLLIEANELATHDISDIVEAAAPLAEEGEMATPIISTNFDGKVVTVAGIVQAVRKTFTKKNNDEMAFVTLEGKNGAKIDCVVFPKTYSENGNKGYWQEGNVLLVTGKVDSRGDRLSLIVERVRRVE